MLLFKGINVEVDILKSEIFSAKEVLIERVSGVFFLPLSLLNISDIERATLFHDGL